MWKTAGYRSMAHDPASQGISMEGSVEEHAIWSRVRLRAKKKTKKTRKSTYQEKKRGGRVGGAKTTPGQPRGKIRPACMYFALIMVVSSSNLVHDGRCNLEYLEG